MQWKVNFRKLLLTNIGTTNSVITDITDRYGPIITVGVVGGVGGDFSHTVVWILSFWLFACRTKNVMLAFPIAWLYTVMI